MTPERLQQFLSDESGAMSSRVNWATVIVAVIVVLLLLWLVF
jgi:hypothetical protein